MQRTEPELLARGARWLEGPCWVGDRLLVSDIHNDRIVAWEGGHTLVDALVDAEFPNGRTRARDGRVYQCSHGRRAVEELHPDMTTSTLVDRVDGVRFNSPNDLVVAADGAIWFTDPPYGITLPEEGHPGEMEYGGCHVFRFDPATGALSTEITDMVAPNGLAFSPDGSILYVADTEPPEGTKGLVRAYEVSGGQAGEGREFFTGSRGVTDGLRVDIEGRLWCTDGDSIALLSSAGAVLDTIAFPIRVANLCFDDDGWLYAAATDSLFRLRAHTVDAALA